MGQSQAKKSRPLPVTVRRAVLYMRVGSGFTLLVGIVLSLLTVQSFRTRVADSGAPGSDGTAYQTGAVVGYVLGFVVWYLFVAALWLWMAKINKAGKNWGRITGTVFFGIYTCIAFFSLIVGLVVAGAQGSGVAMFAVASTILTWLIGLFTIVLLWNAKSAPHFATVPKRYPVPAGYYPPVPPSTTTMDAVAAHQPSADPWSTPSSQA